MCPSGKCFGRRSRDENFCGAMRARRGRCVLVCAAEDGWEGPGRSRMLFCHSWSWRRDVKFGELRFCWHSCRTQAAKFDLFCAIELLCLNLGSHLARPRMADASQRARYSIGKLGTIILCAVLPPLLVPPRPLGLPKQGAHGVGPQATVPLHASETRKFQLGPGEQTNFLYEAEAQSAISISFVQTEEMLSVTWSSGGALQLPRTNDAGLRSAIRFFLVPGEKTQETFDISCLHTHLSCAGTVTVSEARPAVPADA